MRTRQSAVESGLTGVAGEPVNASDPSYASARRDGAARNPMAVPIRSDAAHRQAPATDAFQIIEAPEHD